MINCARGMFCERLYELMVGIITSWFPFTTRVVWEIPLSSENRSPRTWRHSVMASLCATIVWERARRIDILFSYLAQRRTKIFDSRTESIKNASREMKAGPYGGCTWHIFFCWL